MTDKGLTKKDEQLVELLMRTGLSKNIAKTLVYLRKKEETTSVEIESAIRKALLVLKLRGSDHAKDIRQFEITDHGIEIMSRFEGQEGIMSGSPRRMAEAFDQAFRPRSG